MMSFSSTARRRGFVGTLLFFSLLLISFSSSHAADDNVTTVVIDADADVDAVYVPGNASWLDKGGSGDTTRNPPEDYKQFFPINYVIFGMGSTPHVRSIIDIDSTEGCPKPIHADTDAGLVYSTEQRSTGGSSPRAMDMRYANGNPVNKNKMPYKFPVKVCEHVVEENTPGRDALDEGKYTILYGGKQYKIPQVKRNPSKFMLIGDTGLRSKPTDLGLGKCNGPEIYGVKQCEENFTESDLNQEEQDGSFQSLDKWVFPDLCNDVVKNHIDTDVIVYVGDYFYRQGPCPFDVVDSETNTTESCSAMNLPEFAKASEIPPDVTMNFIPGYWGDNWWGWYADFFYPAMELLQTAPFIPTRGNHEKCGRGGYGYFLFLSPNEPDENEDVLQCETQSKIYDIKFINEQFLVIDDSEINPLNKGVDHFIPGECPPPLGDGEYYVPLDQPLSDEASKDNIKVYTEHLQRMEKYSQNYGTNFYVGHRPLLGLGCNEGEFVTLDWTLQQSLGPNTLDRISAIISGHMHWLEVFEFEDNALPPQIIVGNGGTKLINAHDIDNNALTNIKFNIGKPEYNITGRVKSGEIKFEYGYGMMTRDDETGDYNVMFYTWQNETKSVIPMDYSITIPKGPRVKKNKNNKESKKKKKQKKGTDKTGKSIKKAK